MDTRIPVNKPPWGLQAGQVLVLLDGIQAREKTTAAEPTVNQTYYRKLIVPYAGVITAIEAESDGSGFTADF